MEPRYIHDCDSCIYLGQYKEFDLYYCPGEPTVVCRYSDDGPDYGSGLISAVSEDITEDLNEYQVALIRAMKKSVEIRNTIYDYFDKYYSTDQIRIARFMELYRLSFSPEEV